MDFAITINEQTLELGQTLDRPKMVAANFRQVGLLSGILMKIPMGQARFDSRDCTFNFFSDELSFYPCTDSYLTRDRQWSTEASLFFKNDTLFRMVFKVIDGQYAAANFVERFNETCTNKMGTPLSENRRKKKWSNAKSTVETILHVDSINAEFIIEQI